MVNTTVQKTIGAINFNQNAEDLYREIVKDKLSTIKNTPKQSIDSINKKIEELKVRLTNLQDLLVDGTVSADDYRQMRSRYISEKEELEKKIGGDGEDSRILKMKLGECLNSLKNLDQLYFKAEIRNKQRIISSIFPGKLIFDGEKCRTQRLNEAISLIINTDNTFNKNKTGQKENISLLSGLVESAGFEPASKHIPDKLSTCLFLYCISGSCRNRTNQHPPNLL